jgi:hypothetical protein
MRHVLFILGLVPVVLAFSETDASTAESHDATRICDRALTQLWRDTHLHSTPMARATAVNVVLATSNIRSYIKSEGQEEKDP